MPDGAEIKIDTAVMAAVAQEISTQRATVMNILTDIAEENRTLDEGESCWEGASAEAYFKYRDKVLFSSFEDYMAHPELNVIYIIHTLAYFEEVLDKAVAQYSDTENKMESRIDALPTDIFL